MTPQQLAAVIIVAVVLLALSQLVRLVAQIQSRNELRLIRREFFRVNAYLLRRENELPNSREREHQRL